MTKDSRYIPINLKRQLLAECGHRCSVPRCNSTSALQFEHIEEWAKLNPKKHDFDKMIVLCATCHSRVTSKEIDKSTIRGYKRNLAIISGRYSLFEMRLIQSYAESELQVLEIGELKWQGNVPTVFSDVELIHLKGLIDDKMLLVSPCKVLNDVFSYLIRCMIKSPDGSNRSLQATLGLNRYYVFPEKKFLKLIERFVSGTEMQD